MEEEGAVAERARYGVLHGAARQLIEELQERFEVDVLPMASDEAAGLPRVLEALRLVPDGGGATVAVALTDFPGVRVAFGQWHTLYFPRCGCADCDEDPDELVDDLRSMFEATAAGRYFEAAHGYRFELADGSVESASSRPVAKFVAYRPWPPKSS